MINALRRLYNAIGATLPSDLQNTPAFTVPEDTLPLPEITKEQFAIVLDCSAASAAAGGYITHQGWRESGVILRCFCGPETGCQGWAFIHTELVAHHLLSDGRPKP